MVRAVTEKNIDDFSENTGTKIFKVADWKTLCTDYPLKECGTAKLVRKKRRRGSIYPMENVGGYGYWAPINPIEITMLYINGRCWMTDEPINLVGLQKIAESSAGKVFVAGLGLGMVAQFLAQNPKVTEITVLERNHDVIELISPLISHPKIRVVEGDFWASEFENTISVEDGKVRVKHLDYDTVILDIWVWDRTKDSERYITRCLSEVIGAITKCQMACPEAKVFVWGLCDKQFNPAIQDP